VAGFRTLAAGLAAAVAISPAAPAQTIVLVRHAERADASPDPDLAPAGQARALALAEALKGGRLTLVLTTPLKRTQQTARPAADAAGVAITPISTEGGAAHIQLVADAARKAPANATVLIVGHSNTVPDIARALGDVAAPTLTDCDYDRLTVIALGGLEPKVVHARYGAPTPAC